MSEDKDILKGLKLPDISFNLPDVKLTEAIPLEEEKEEKDKGWFVEGMSKTFKDIASIPKYAWHSFAYSTNDAIDKLLGAGVLALTSKETEAKLTGRLDEEMVAKWIKDKIQSMRKGLKQTKEEEMLKVEKGKEEKKTIAPEVGEIAGGLPVGVAEYLANIPWAMAGQIVDEMDKREWKTPDQPSEALDIMAKTLTQGFKRWLIGRTFKAIEKAKPVKALLGSALLGAGDYTAENIIQAEWNENFLTSFAQNFSPVEAVKSASVLTFLQAYGINKKLKAEKLREKAKVELKDLIKEEYKDAKVDGKPVDKYVEENVKRMEELSQDPEKVEEARQIAQETANNLHKIKEGEVNVETEPIEIMQQWKRQLEILKEEKNKAKQIELEKNRIHKETIKNIDYFEDNKYWAKYLRRNITEEEFKGKLNAIIRDLKDDLEIAKNEAKKAELKNKINALNNAINNAKDILEASNKLDIEKLGNYFKDISDISKGRSILEIEPEEIKPTEIKPTEIKPEEVKPIEIKPEEIKKEEAKPLEAIEEKKVEEVSKEIPTEEVKTEEKPKKEPIPEIKAETKIEEEPITQKTEEKIEMKAEEKSEGAKIELLDKIRKNIIAIAEDSKRFESEGYFFSEYHEALTDFAGVKRKYNIAMANLNMTKADIRQMQMKLEKMNEPYWKTVLTKEEIEEMRKERKKLIPKIEEEKKKLKEYQKKFEEISHKYEMALKAREICEDIFGKNMSYIQNVRKLLEFFIDVYKQKQKGLKSEDIVIPEDLIKEIRKNHPEIEKALEVKKAETETKEAEAEKPVEEKKKKISEMTEEEQAKARKRIEELEKEINEKGTNNIIIGQEKFKDIKGKAFFKIFKPYMDYIKDKQEFKKDLDASIDMKLWEYIQTYGEKPSPQTIYNFVTNIKNEMIAEKRFGELEDRSIQQLKEKGVEMREVEKTPEMEAKEKLFKRLSEEVEGEFEEYMQKSASLPEDFADRYGDIVIGSVTKEVYMPYVDQYGKRMTKVQIRKAIANKIKDIMQKDPTVKRTRKRKMKGTVGELFEAGDTKAEEAEVADTIANAENKIKTSGFITDFGLGDLIIGTADKLKKINTNIAEKLKDRNAVKKWKREAGAKINLILEVVDRINKLNAQKDIEQFRKLRQDFIDEYGITPENYLKTFGNIYQDIRAIQRYISFPETLARKNPYFRKIYDGMINILQDRTRLIFELRDNYKLNEILNEIDKNENVKNLLYDAKYAIILGKLKDYDYMSQKGFTKEEYIKIQNLIENNNNPRRTIYSIINAKENWLKNNGLFDIANKLRRLREEWNENIKNINNKNIKDLWDLNEADINLLNDFKALNDRMYKDTMDSIMKAIEERWQGNDEKMIAEKERLLEYLIDHYDPFYFNKEHPKAKYTLLIRQSGAKPLALFFESEKEAIEAMKQYKRMGYENIEIEKYKSSARLDYLIPVDKMSELNAYDPQIVKELFEGEEIPGYWGRLLSAKFLPDENLDLKRNTASYVLQWSNFIAKRNHKGKMVEALKKLKETMPKSNMLITAEKYYNDVMFPKTNWMARFTGYLGAYYLAGNIKSAMIQFTQPFLLTYPYLVGKTNNAVKATKLLIQGYKDTMDFFLRPEKMDKQKYENAKYFWEREMEMGVAETDMLREMMRGQSAWNKAISISMYPFQYADRIQRLIAFFSGYNIDKNYSQAVEVSRETNFNYARANRPELARGLLSPIFALRMFEGHYFRLMKEYLQEKQWKALTTQAITTGILGGIIGLPFSAQLINALQWAGVNIDYEMRKLLKDNTITELLLYGAPILAGINISYSLSIGRYLPAMDRNFAYNFLKSVLGVSGDYLDRTSRALNYAIMQKQYGKAFTRIMPIAIYNMVRARETYEEGIQAKGKKPLVRRDEPYLQYLTILKGLGIQNIEQTLQYVYEEMARSKSYTPAEKREFYQMLLDRKSPIREKINNLFKEEGK
ncbi:MAG: hypothetical protein QXV73_04535 [Candidatus Micrarchaeia archaeon]